MRIAIYSLTKEGTKTAANLANKLENSDLFVLEKYIYNANSSFESFPSGGLGNIIKKKWDKYDAHIFFMATGIVVRKIAGLLKNKTVDPAILVSDEKGNFIISLVSGHIGGGNRLTARVANLLEGQAVITTATDVQGLQAFDEMASINNWKVENPENIKYLNSMLLDGKKIAVDIPEDIYNKEYKSKNNITLFSEELNLDEYEGLVALNSQKQISNKNIKILYLTSK